MTIIRSDMTVAQSYATGLQSAGEELAGVDQPQQDNQTTVAGNTNAHEALATSQSTRQSIASAITSMVTNLRSVASEFEAVDQEIGNQISNGGD
ncbi:TIGR04197 family type VII secretion effector [Streptococcus rifensis]